MNRVVIRYHEVALKGNNRTVFVRKLSDNIARMLEGTGVQRIHRAPGRIILSLSRRAEWPEIRSRLERVFGIANFLLSRHTAFSLDAMSSAILDAVDGLGFSSFAVRTRRSDKTFPVQSPEISRIIGQAVQERTGSRVDLKNPQQEIHIEILPREMLFSLEKVDGPGGLPIGSSGTVLALISGGIDSPVAVHRMLKRGCRVDFVHFHSVPFQSRASQEKVQELVEELSAWQPDANLHMVPFGRVQRQIVLQAKPLLRVILYRRMMMRIAQAIAKRTGAIALVTGDSLGQVASQTIPNLAVVEEASDLPVLRPLIAMDKQEITLQAERIGTYPISIQPDEDCCQLFVPRHPATRTNLPQVRETESPIDVDGLVAATLAEVQSQAITAGRPDLSLAAAGPG